MDRDNVVELKKPASFIDDPITDILRSGARKLLAEALEAEIEGFLAMYADVKDSMGHQRITRNGYLPEREIQTGVGTVAVKVPRVRDRGSLDETDRILFSSALLPPYLRRTKSMEELIPWLYLKGISTGDFSEALSQRRRMRGTQQVGVFQQPPPIKKARDMTPGLYIFIGGGAGN